MSVVSNLNLVREVQMMNASGSVTSLLFSKSSSVKCGISHTPSGIALILLSWAMIRWTRIQRLHVSGRRLIWLLEHRSSVRLDILVASSGSSTSWLLSSSRYVSEVSCLMSTGTERRVLSESERVCTMSIRSTTCGISRRSMSLRASVRVSRASNTSRRNLRMCALLPLTRSSGGTMSLSFCSRLSSMRFGMNPSSCETPGRPHADGSVRSRFPAARRFLRLVILGIECGSSVSLLLLTESS
mmetsp:Transcript_66589/g.152590  ORF Transcript_66589/g.152590 Transcript_66589/m.152590 type:complete len:242 (-) Transcript_66589:261-986(-)